MGILHVRSPLCLFPFSSTISICTSSGTLGPLGWKLSPTFSCDTTRLWTIDIDCQVLRMPVTAGKTLLAHLGFGNELSGNNNSLLMQPWGKHFPDYIFANWEILNCDLYFPVKQRRQTPCPASLSLPPDCKTLPPSQQHLSNMIPRRAGYVLTQPYPVQTASAHTSARNRMGYPIPPTLPSLLQHFPLLSSPGKQGTSNTAFCWGTGKALSLNNLLHRKGYSQRCCQREQKWPAPQNRRKPRSGFCSQPGTEPWQSPSIACKGVTGARTVPGCSLSHEPAIYRGREAQRTCRMIRLIWLNSHKFSILSLQVFWPFVE